MKSIAEININIKRLFYRLNLTAITLGGYLALCSFLHVVPYIQSSLVLSFSWKILLTGAAVFLLVSALAVFTIRAWLGKGGALQDKFLEPANKALRIFLWGIFLLSTVAGVLLALFSDHRLDPLLSQYLIALLWRAAPLLGWVTTSLLQTSLLWLLFQPRQENTSADPAKGLLPVSAVITAVYALTLILALPLLPPGWAWTRSLRPFQTQGVWVVLLLVPFFILVNYGLLRKKVRPTLALAGLIVIGYILTLAVGEGPARMEFSLINSRPAIYLEKACIADSVGEVIRQYDHKFIDHHWLATKPPGLLTSYTLMRQVLVPDQSLSGLDCHQQFAQTGAWLFPLFSALMLLPLYFFGRQLLGNEAAWLACAFYVLTTSLVKFARFADAFLFPLLTLVTLYLLFLSLRRLSPWLALAASVMSALSIFVSFSLLPLVGIALAWMVIRIMSQEKSRKRIVLALASYLAGIFVLTLVLYYWLGYNPLERYRAAMAAHTSFKLFRPGIGQVITAVSVNNLEYFAFSGLAVSALFLYRFFKAFWEKRIGELTLFEGLLWAAAAAYLVMNVVGKTIGEVGRIWMFFTPLLCLGAADAAVTYFGSRRREINMVFGLQAATLLINLSFLLILY